MLLDDKDVDVKWGLCRMLISLCSGAKQEGKQSKQKGGETHDNISPRLVFQNDIEGMDHTYIQRHKHKT